MFEFILILYAPLLLKGVVSLIRLDRLLPLIASFLGRIEYLLSPLRDTLIAVAIGVYGIVHWVRQGYDPKDLLLICLFVLSLVHWIHRRKIRLNLCRFVLRFDSVEPNQFFQIYYRCLGSFSNQIPREAKAVNYSYIDYRRGRKPRHTIGPLITGAFDTATLAKLAILAMKRLPGEEGIDAFDAFARIWGARFVAQAHLKLHTVGAEGLPPLHGKVLLVFNHKSYLDFSLNFFALGNLRNKGRHLRPRFIAAKDHFVDNPAIYSWVGLGKCIERAGMIFINRKKGKGWQAMKEAAQKLTDTDVEVAVYPQGTRAWGLTDEKGGRIDAGYYTTFAKKTLGEARGHLRIGTAQLVLDAALKLRETGAPPLHVLFIGIDGTATVGPKGSFKIQTESEVAFRIGHCWKVTLPHEIELENPGGGPPSKEAHENYLDELEAIQGKIDREMEKSIGRHKTLMERISHDPRVPRPQLMQIKNYLQRADETENILPFVVLDRIYALPSSLWQKYLSSFTQLVCENREKEAWEGLNQMASMELIKK